MIRFGFISLLITQCLVFTTSAQPASSHPNGTMISSSTLHTNFKKPATNYRPETWFHLIGGNVSKTGLTVDLQAVAAAGLQGVQLFHGSGQEWPGVSPQITCLSASWDEMIAHVGRETERLGLTFTMQNCPGWAMSGGPWITPDNAMRHLIWSRCDVRGGETVSITLPKPQPSDEEWRDYRDVAVLAFPTPQSDDGGYLMPSKIQSNVNDLPWVNVLAGDEQKECRINPSSPPSWVEVSFDSAVTLRTIELLPVELLMLRRNFDPASSIRLQALGPDSWVDIGHRSIPRGTWQDRQPEMSLVLAFSDYPAKRFRIIFENEYPMELKRLRLSSAARIHDWRGQAGFALRSLDRSPTPTQNAAAWISADDIIDLSTYLKEGGAVTWKAPAGQWTIVRFGHINTGVKNKPAPPEATGFECDKLSPRGADQHFAGYIGRLTQADGPIENQLEGMLIDSWECYTQTWTLDMEREFVERRGYNLRQWLPALAGWVVENHDTSERFLRDWRATISDLLVDNYFGRLAELGRQRGLKLSFETAIGDVSPGDILQYFSNADIPMCEFWQPNDPHWGGFETKPIHPTVSAAHVYGKPRIAAEAFTNIGIRWNEHPFDLKHKADQHFALGVNHLVFHTFTHNPRQDLVPGTSFGSRIGTPFIRGQTWWRVMPLFTDYLSRCQYLLQQGVPVADVLWYLGDDLDHKPRQDTPFPLGYTFDYINFDALVNRITVVDGFLQTPEGVQWQVLWMPAQTCRRLKASTLKKVHRLLLDGATVIGPPPEQNPTLSGGAKADAEFDEFVQKIWGERKPNGDRRIGNGRLLWGNSLEKNLSQVEIMPDLIGARSATWCHRRVDETDIYFISAARQTPLNANLRFRAHGQPELWDPMSGIIRPAPIYHRMDDYISLPVELPAAGSLFVIFRDGASAKHFTAISHNGKILYDAMNATKIDQGKPYPNFGLTLEDTLQPWINTQPAKIIVDANEPGMIGWEDGIYKFLNNDKESYTVEITGARHMPLDAPWTLTFPDGWDTVKKIEIEKPMPWSSLDDPATRAFSGTATYSTSFQVDNIDKDNRFVLDLGRVANIAEITVNDKSVATMWAPPFRVDITPYLQPGVNHLSLNVTNTWHNRLVYDAALLENERKTWTIHAPSADAELELAGLVGPVVLRVGKAVSVAR